MEIILSILLMIYFIRVINLKIDRDQLQTDIYILRIEKNKLMLEKNELIAEKENKIDELNLIIETLKKEPDNLRELLYSKEKQISNLHIRLGYR